MFLKKKIIHIVLCQGGNHNIHVLDIDDQNIMYVFAFKGINDAYVNFNLNNIKVFNLFKLSV